MRRNYSRERAIASVLCNATDAGGTGQQRQAGDSRRPMSDGFPLLTAVEHIESFTP
ncbi:MAG: hypothetical protein R6U67_09770 [Sodalinema sp.]|uniref:hypothetical protein n=1 Tax=Sodalinema sp. TaxID=3080550 RepID=UPI00396F6768